MDENENKAPESILIDPEVLASIKEQLGDTINFEFLNDENLSSILGLLGMEDDQFELLAPIVLQDYEKSLNNPNTKLSLAQSLNASGLTVEEISPMFTGITEAIDEALGELSSKKRDFLKNIAALIMNAVNETEGISKRIINVPIELCRPGAKMPTYAHDTDAGADIYCPQEITIQPGEQVKVPTGLKIACPVGYAMLVHPRSGLASRSKMRICNSIGLIDSGYRDEVCVLIENTDNSVRDVTSHYDDNGQLQIDSILYGSPIVIGAGERFAQFRLVEVPRANFMEVKSVLKYEGDRGGGFGSSGMM